MTFQQSGVWLNAWRWFMARRCSDLCRDLLTLRKALSWAMLTLKLSSELTFQVWWLHHWLLQTFPSFGLLLSGLSSWYVAIHPCQPSFPTDTTDLSWTYWTIWGKGIQAACIRWMTTALTFISCCLFVWKSLKLCLSCATSYKGLCKQYKAVIEVRTGQLVPLYLYWIILDLCMFLCIADDSETGESVEIPGSYNPSIGAAYYFTPHGNQIRQTPCYDIPGSNSNNDDLPRVDSECKKSFPKVKLAGQGNRGWFWGCQGLKVTAG